MGACCGKEDTPDNFTGPGRVLGSAPPRQTTAPVPSPAKRKVGGPPRTLGGGGSTPASPAEASASSPNPDDARRKAALAAQARAEPSKPVGKLGLQLQAEQARTRVETLKVASQDERLRREEQAHQEVMNYK